MSTTTTAPRRPGPPGVDPLIIGIRLLLGLFGAFKLYGTVYFVFFATAAQGGDPRESSTGCVVAWSFALARALIVAAVRLGSGSPPDRRRHLGAAAGRDRVQLREAVRATASRRPSASWPSTWCCWPCRGGVRRAPALSRFSQTCSRPLFGTHPVLADPGVHRDAGGDAGVDRAGRAELGDRQHDVAPPRGPRRTGRGPPARTAARSARGQRRPSPAARRPGRLSTADDGSPSAAAKSTSDGDVGVVADVLVAVGDHRPAPVPAAAADDVHLGGEEGVGGADDRADVEVVLPVLDGHVEGVPARSRSATIASSVQ